MIGKSHTRKEHLIIKLDVGLEVTIYSCDGSQPWSRVSFPGGSGFGGMKGSQRAGEA